MDIYGGTKKETGEVNFIPYLYQGQYLDVETGLAYISQDPIKLAGGRNIYSYVKDSNLWVDVFGLAKACLKAGDGVTHDLVLTLKKSDYPETGKHIQDAINAGHPDVLTILRGTAKSNRKKSLKGIPTKKGFDRDEYPMAMFTEGGEGASIRYIDPSDNRGAGSAIGNALSSFEDGTTVKIVIID